MDQLLEGIEGARITNYMTASATVVLVVDYLHMLPLEIEFIWSQPFNRVKFMYLLARYTAPLQLILVFTHALSSSLSVNQCRTLFIAIPFLSILNAAPSEAILYWRAFAFAGRTRLMGAFLLLQYLTNFAVVLGVISKVYTSAKHVIIPLADLHCVPLLQEMTLFGLAFAIPLVPQCSVLAVMIMSAYVKYRHVRSRIKTALIYDGVIYILAATSLAIVNTAMVIAGPEHLKFMLAMSQAVALPIIATRMTIHLRALSEDDRMSGDQTGMDMTTLAIASFPTLECGIGTSAGTSAGNVS